MTLLTYCVTFWKRKREKSGPPLAFWMKLAPPMRSDLYSESEPQPNAESLRAATDQALHCSHCDSGCGCAVSPSRINACLRSAVAACMTSHTVQLIERLHGDRLQAAGRPSISFDSRCDPRIPVVVFAAAASSTMVACRRAGEQQQPVTTEI